MDWIRDLRERLARFIADEEFVFLDTSQRLQDAFLSRRASLEGCRPEEILGLERQFGVHFPDSYREYLLALGRSSAMLFDDSDTSFGLLPALQVELRDSLEDAGAPFDLPPEAFAVRRRRGAESWWILARAGSDSPVLHWQEWDERPTVVAPSFRQYVLDAVRHAEARASLAGRDPQRVVVRRDAVGQIQFEYSRRGRLAS